MDMSALYQTFFDEADELLADMEQQLLQFNPSEPDNEQLNAIFRAAHSIKGGAGTFGFTALQQTTHLLENLLDTARQGEMSLTVSIISLFLETKDIMQQQVDAYKASLEPDAESFDYICQALRQLALEAQAVSPSVSAPSAPAVAQTQSWQIKLQQLTPALIPMLIEELGHLGQVATLQHTDTDLQATLITDSSPDAIQAVLCFILEPEQIVIDSTAIVPSCQPVAAAAAEVTPQQITSPEINPQAITPLTAKPAEKPVNRVENNSIRVAVNKVDQLINLVGELVITQSMLSQLSQALDGSHHADLLNSIKQLENNTRELQGSVMSIRMMPMDYAFSRFPRLVHDIAEKMHKQVELVLQGGAVELDKSLIERIIDPLTHLVRNSLDHGIEEASVRQRNGKSPTGKLILSAEHQGGNIYIEVIDDGAGLDRQKILAKAQAQGLSVSDALTDAEVWMLIFAPGFSTAAQVTEFSGRGVGMDVVKRNIQQLNGHVQVDSSPGKGTSIRIVLPLTMAILDGMLVKAGEHTFILPLNAVRESLQPQASDLYAMAGGELMLQVRNEYLPLVALHRVFDINNAVEHPPQGIVVVLQSAGQRFALLVDQLLGQSQVVVKNLEKNYRKVAGISAATILGDGNVALILDVPALQKLHQTKRLV